MASSVFFFAAGIWIVQQFPQLPDEWHWLASACVLIGILLRLKFRKAATFLFGMLWAIVYALIGLSNRLPVDLESKIIPIQGRITGLPRQSDRRVRFNLTDIQGPEGIPKKLRLSWYNPKQEIKAGQYWAFSVKLKRPHGNLNPGGFDYERWLLSEGIGATGYVRDRPSPVLVSDKTLFFNISTWRQQLSDKLNNAGVSSDTIGIIKALAIGERRELSSAQWNIFRNTGTVHLIAISGLHIGLISGLIYLTVVKFWARTGVLRWSPHHAGALAALFIAALYAGLAGFSVPTQRALIMLAAVMFSVIWQRNVSLSNTLALALFAVLAMDPLAILSPGFWLSFLAVIFIVFIAGGRLQKTNRWLAALKIHWAMALALAPVLLFFFQQTSLIAPLANLIAVPVVSFLVVPI
ncbi:MAG: DNA internalization-related competence protein ComEC/Rec2, partial [Methylomicrobium sp.]|nr:DNA internalization-related competence protein ComEC/Rec2 [Methylomicrobium sp.]